MQKSQFYLVITFILASNCINANAAETNIRELTSAERIRLAQLKREIGTLANKAKKLVKEIEKKLKKSNSRRKKLGEKKVKLEIPEFKCPASVFKTDHYGDREIRETTAKLEWATNHIKELEELYDIQFDGKSHKKKKKRTKKIDVTGKILSIF